MEHALARDIGAFPDILTSGNGPPSILERLLPGPLAQLGPLRGSLVSPRCCPTGNLPLPRAEPEVLPMPSKTYNPGGFVVRHTTTGNNKTSSKGEPAEPVDLCDDLADF